MRPRSRFPLALTATTLLLACSDNATDPPVEPEEAEVDELVASLGTWEAYAPPLTDGESSAGSPVTRDEVVGATTYTCTVEPRSLTSTPNSIVMYEPNASIMWVGNLLQGDSYKGGTGSFEELSIRQRAPLKISIDLLTGDNSAIVENPSLTSVNAAIGGLIQRAHDAGHRSGSSVQYLYSKMNVEIEAMLNLGLSGTFTFKGIPVGLKAEQGWETNASLTGVFAHFTQKMFTISIELPQSPSSFFSEELTPDLLQEQVDAGNIGPNNLPVYIASITYGRTLAYTLVDAKSETELTTAVEASFKGIPQVASLNVQTEAQLRNTLSATRLRATSIGGEGTDVISLIREGQLTAYFTDDAALTSARPISYQLNYLGDNSIAKVSETTDYDLRTCNEKPVSPGRFDFVDLQSVATGVNAPYNVLTGDLNEDGRGDVVLNSILGGPNQVRIGLGNADGSFTFGSVITHPVTPPEGWAANYSAHIGDFDGDGDDDLVWTRPGAPRRQVYMALSDGAGGFAFQPVQELGTTAWAAEWKTHVGNIDNDTDDDLFFSYQVLANNFSIIARSTGGGTFALGERLDLPAGSAGPNYDVFVGDVDGGPTDDDFIWNWVNSASSGNHVYVARSLGDSLQYLGFQNFSSGWSGYVNHMGDINGDTRADLIWVKSSGNFAVHRAHGQGNSSFLFRNGAQSHTRDASFFGASGSVPTEVGDFNGDGNTDILFNRRTAAGTTVMVGLGHNDGDFRFTSVPQNHPVTSEDWTQFTPLPLDVTGDGVDDVVWVQKTPTMKIYVATGRP